MQFRIESSDVRLASFTYDDTEYHITRNFGLSNSFSISTQEHSSAFGDTSSPEGLITSTKLVGLITWISQRNEFAISVDGDYFLPFNVIIPEARKASIAWWKSLAD